MLKRNALSIALLLGALALWSVPPVIGQDTDEPEPTVDEVLTDHAERIAELERQVGSPAREAGSLDARLRAAELEIDQLERDLAQVEDDDDNGGTGLRDLQRSVDALTARIERIDRNRLAAIEREINNLERELRNFDQRLRRVE